MKRVQISMINSTISARIHEAALDTITDKWGNSEMLRIQDEYGEMCYVNKRNVEYIRVLPDVPTD